MDANHFKNSPPKMCGFYSITTDREFDESTSSLRYFKYPRLPLNLDRGIENIKTKPDSYYEEKMDSLLRYIVENKGKLEESSDGSNGTALQYVTYRGIIKMIMSSPYEKYKGWCILATKYKNKIYLCQRTSKESRETFENQPFWIKKFCYYGPKFEQCCLSDDPAKPPDTSERLDECAQFFCVFKRMLVGRNFFFAGEMDGVDSNVPVNLENSKNFNNLKFIELKVLPNTTPTNHEKFVSKCQAIWTQSFLTGVDDVYFGMRDQRGVVREIKHFTLDMLLECGRNSWSTEKCFGFLEKFLNLVEEKMQNVNCPYSVFEFNLDLDTKKISDVRRHNGKTVLSILPDWYIQTLN